LLLFSNWVWLLGVVGAAIWAVLEGADRIALGWAAALAIAPALAGFALAGRVERGRSLRGYLLVWLVAATGLAIGGEVAGPLLAVFLVAPALALRSGRTTRALAAIGAVIGMAAAIVFDGAAPAAALGPFPLGLGISAVVVAALAVGMSGPRPDVIGARLAEAAHEVRTPLTHILGFAEMIERRMLGGEIDERYVEYGQLIRRSGSQLLELVNDLLDLSSIEAGRNPLTLERFDARDVVAEVVRLSVDAAARKHIALAMTTPEPALTIRADRQALRRMLINTIGNAIKFTPEGGQVLVRAAEEADGLVLETRDSGPGFSPGDRNRLGVAYERGASPDAGSGLGLALVRALARQHGGEVSFHDAPEGGALVRIALPVISVGS
jgi:signal transduction histidine kinase